MFFNLFPQWPQLTRISTDEDLVLVEGMTSGMPPNSEFL